MTGRRPLVQAGGKTQQLPPGDTLLGLPLFVPVAKQSGALLRLSLTTTYGIPVQTRAGTSVAVQVVLNG